MSAKFEWNDLPTDAPGKAVTITCKGGDEPWAGYAWIGSYFDYPNVEMRAYHPAVNIIANVNISVDSIESITPIRGYEGFMEPLS